MCLFGSTNVEFHHATEFTFTAYPYEKLNFEIFYIYIFHLFLFCITFYFPKNQHVQCFCIVEVFMLALYFLTNNVNLKKKKTRNNLNSLRYKMCCKSGELKSKWPCTFIENNVSFHLSQTIQFIFDTV